MKSREAKFDFVAVFLILAQPFIEFVYTNRFILEIVNVITLAGYIVVALAITLFINKYPNRVVRSVIWTALIVLFLDVRVNIFDSFALATIFVIAVCLIVAWILYLHANKILVAVFGVVFAFNLLLPIFPRVQEYPAAHGTNDDRTGDLPVYVHIILDEHIGVEVLDEDIDNQKDLKQNIKKLFINNGFRLFGRAYSEYFTSTDSLSAAFNKYSGDNPTQYYTYDETSNTNSLSNDKYLNDLFLDGYNIQIYQSSWFNFCDLGKELVQKCLTYNLDGLSSQALVQLDTAEKFDLIHTKFWHKSYIKGWLHYVYAVMEIVFQEIGVELPHWTFAPNKSVGPISVLPIFDQLIADVANARNGTMFLAHLLIPHGPYTVDEGCKIRRPLMNGKRTWSLKPLSDGRENTESSRLERYDDYVDQVGCSLSKIGELIEAMQSTGIFDSSIIIIHGDHGSRIAQFRPRILNKNRLSQQDFYDGYSTLFAVKAPHIAPGYDLQMLPLESLLRYAADDESIAPELPEGHFVYLRDEITFETFIKVPMPEIPNSSDTVWGDNH